jgi:D-serine deaminase-like pyridoxal phosphate-dependent protein
LRLALLAFGDYFLSMIDDSSAWYQVRDHSAVPSPALLVYPERIVANLRAMIRVASGPQRLWPHVKTHKLPEIVRLKLAEGITQFKCATIAEAEMVAGCGAPQILVAYQPVGPNVQRLLALIRAFPGTEFATLVDNAASIRVLSAAAASAGLTVRVLLDLDCGMGRTGIPPGSEAAGLYRMAAGLPGLIPAGLHAYDGHLSDPDESARTAAARAGMAPVKRLRDRLQGEGLPVPRIIAGGTPTVPIHAQDPELDCSPGTNVLWDGHSAARIPHQPFIFAAALLTRVVSVPGPHRLCLDLGHKAVAAEHSFPRVALLGLPDAKFLIHSEEHLVIESPRAADYQVGDAIYGIPWHICPTVALHARAVPIVNGSAGIPWAVRARDRVLTI